MLTHCDGASNADVVFEDKHREKYIVMNPYTDFPLILAD